jgi:hypothetical protein
MAKTWAQERAAQIRKDARRDYGAGWSRLSDAQKEEYIMSRVLLLVLSQDSEQFKAAQDMARDVLAATRDADA